MEILFRSPHLEVFCKISQNSQENNCNFIKKETLAQVFSCEFCEISKKKKKEFYIEHLWWLLPFYSKVS